MAAVNAHTPGPWRAESGCIYSVAHERDYSTNPKDAPYIWRVCEGLHGKSMEEIEANARLIAAAPELLAALEKAFIEMGRMGANHDLEHPCRLAWSLARDAIAKAMQS